MLFSVEKDDVLAEVWTGIGKALVKRYSSQVGPMPLHSTSRQA